MCIEIFMNNQKYIQDAITKAIDTMQPVLQAAKPYCDTIVNEFKTIEAQVERWTEAHLPKPIDKIAMQALRALPPALAFIFLPTIITVPLAFSVLAIQVVKPEILHPRMNAALLNGLAISGFKDAIAGIAQFTSTGKSSALVGAILNTVSAAYMAVRAHAFEKLATEPKTV